MTLEDVTLIRERAQQLEEELRRLSAALQDAASAVDTLPPPGRTQARNVRLAVTTAREFAQRCQVALGMAQHALKMSV